MVEKVDSLLRTHLHAEPHVGQAATVCQWTDRWPATVVRATSRTVMVREDRAVLVSKDGDTQVWAVTPNLGGDVHKFTLRKWGGWVQAGAPVGCGLELRLGTRSRYHDFSV